jgi:RimJ/RimL family protein N-acetyltransferase
MENRMTFTSYESSMGAMISFRPATTSDSDALFEWRNDPDSREASLSRDPVSRDDHDAWFARSLHSTARWIVMATDESGERIGMCRFDLDVASSSAEISINLNPAWRGRGLASTVLDGGIAAFREHNPNLIRLTATIRHSNRASARIFLGHGFELEASEGGVDHYCSV